MNYKRFTNVDMALTKLSVFCIALFLVSAWADFVVWVRNVHWAWFLLLGLALAIKPIVTVLRN